MALAVYRLDQGRRVGEVAIALQQQGMTDRIGETGRRGDGETQVAAFPHSLTPVALNFEPIAPHSIPLVRPQGNPSHLTSPTPAAVGLNFEPESQPGRYLASAKS
jgi:hypothetical protein